jgi:hypothetical protein
MSFQGYDQNWVGAGEVKVREDGIAVLDGEYTGTNRGKISWPLARNGDSIGGSWIGGRFGTMFRGSLNKLNKK